MEYTEKKSASYTDGTLVDGIWKVVTTVSESRRVSSDDEWEETSVSVMVYDDSFEVAQQKAVGFLYNRITEAIEKTGGSSLFDLHLDEKEKENEESETESN